VPRRLSHLGGALRTDHGPIHEKLLTYLDDLPLITFIYDALQTELLDTDDYDSDVPVSQLTDDSQYSDAKGLAARLIEEFDSLPWLYTFSIRLPQSVATLLGTVVENEKLSANVRLVKASQALADTHPLNTADEKRQIRIHGGGSLLFPKTESAEWDNDGIYLQIEVEGFVGAFGVRHLRYRRSDF
jgi:hypothetical protein